MCILSGAKRWLTNFNGLWSCFDRSDKFARMQYSEPKWRLTAMTYAFQDLRSLCIWCWKLIPVTVNILVYCGTLGSLHMLQNRSTESSYPVSLKQGKVNNDASTLLRIKKAPICLWGKNDVSDFINECFDEVLHLIGHYFHIDDASSADLNKNYEIGSCSQKFWKCCNRVTWQGNRHLHKANSGMKLRTLVPG